MKSYFVSSTDVFRRLARTLPLPTDIVLEIGSSFGVATEILARHAETVVGIEHSKEMFDQLENKFAGHSNVTLLWHDARDIHGLLAKLPAIDVLFFDIGGDAPAHLALYVLQLYINAYRPRAAVVRNIALAGMLGDVQMAEFPEKSNYQRYRALPSREEIIEHYSRENRRSGAKFADRESRRDLRNDKGPDAH